jgi:hypothetical protein
MQIVIDNATFDFNTGCKVLKSKHRECPFPELNEFWDDIVPLEFKEVAAIENLESRRVALLYLDIQSVLEQADAKLVKSETLQKTTTWVADDGSLIEHKFDDTYELWQVSRETLTGQRSRWGGGPEMEHFIRMKDTSTDRKYLIWVNLQGVINTNMILHDVRQDNEISYDVSPIAAIAWTIQTTVPAGCIKRIIRQGDCILIEPKPNTELMIVPRHLTESEYRQYLILES